MDAFATKQIVIKKTINNCNVWKDQIEIYYVQNDWRKILIIRKMMIQQMSVITIMEWLLN